MVSPSISKEKWGKVLERQEKENAMASVQQMTYINKSSGKESVCKWGCNRDL